MELEVFRGDDIVAVIETGGKYARFTHGLMNAHKIVVNDVKQYDVLQVQIGDYILRKGIEYKINTDPDLNADDMLSYSITFEGPKYTWHDKLFEHNDENDFSYYGNALMLMELFISNINQIDQGWTLGEIADTPEKHFVFTSGKEGLYCHQAIILIADGFKLEFHEVDKVITMIPKIGRDTGLSFEYGMGNGLYNLTRTHVSDHNVVTKVKGYGGTRNLPVGYRVNKRILTFTPGFYVNNTELYGIKEGKYSNEDIIPERESSVTSVTHGNPLSTITDSTLDFNIKDSVIEGLEPKISFTTGALAGEEFVITDYNPITKVITFKGFVNNNNVVLPNDTFRAEVGDKYVLYDIQLPDSYVAAAEQRVNAETLQYLLENSVPRVEYGGTLDPLHLRENDIELIPGDRVIFKDTRIGLDASIRITEISMPLDFPEVVDKDTTIDITIANFVTYTAQQRLRDEKLIQRHEVKTIDLRSAEQARRNSANFINLRDSVIDPYGNYYTEKLVKGSIEALYLSIGAKATNFNLNNVSFEANAGGNPNSFTATVGQLIHYDIELPGGGFVWEMQPYSVTGLVPANKYYLYAKISKSTNVGSWELATDVKLAESVAGFYILQAGVLFPVKDGRRDNAITKGMVFIVGDQITAGRLQSIDQSMFIDLTTGQLKLGDDQNGMDWNVTNPNRLTIRGGITQNSGGISAPITLFRGAYGPLVTYYNGDSVEYQGSKYVYTYPTPIFNVPPTNATYWTLEVSKGDTGVDGANGSTGATGPAGNHTEFRFAKNGSTTVPPSLTPTDINPTGWTTAQPTVGVAEYAWMTSATKNAAGALVANWGTPIRFNGAKGDTGASGANGTNGTNGTNGAPGPFMSFRGEYNPLSVYYGGTDRIEVVRYLANVYYTRSDAGTIPAGTLPTNTSKFNIFTGQFESISTGLLLATLAYIENLGVRFLATAPPGNKRIEISGALNNMRLLNEADEDLVVIDDDSVLLGFNGQGNPIYGAGVRVGSLSGEHMAISENQINGTGDITVAGSGGFNKHVSCKNLQTGVSADSGSLSDVGLAIVTGNCNLYTYPDDGQMQTIKNRSSSTITISAAETTGRGILTATNTNVISINLTSGGVIRFQYYQADNVWVVI